jgi:hypothetical protein
MFGLGKAHSEKTIAVADIGGESAGVAILGVSGRGAARVIVAERSALSMEDRSSAASASGVLAELGKAAEKALATYAEKFKGKEPLHVEKAYAILRVPWTRSKTIRAESIFPEEAVVEAKTISALAEEALRQDTEFDHAKTLEANVIRVELNGYPTAKPEGKRAKRITVSALLSECEPTLRQGAIEALQRTFSCPPPILRSGVRATFSVLKENHLLQKDCVMICMTTHATHVIAVRKGVVNEISTVPEGGSTILKRIAEGKLPEETLTLMRLLAHDQCEGDACDALRASIARAEPELVKSFGSAFEKMAAVRRIPNAFLLTGPEDLAEWLLHFFSRIDFAPFTVTTRPLSGKLVDHTELAPLVTFEHGVTEDSGLAVASALVNIEEKAAT